MLQAVCTAENPGCWVTKWLDLRISIQTMVWTVATVEWTEDIRSLVGNMDENLQTPASSCCEDRNSSYLKLPDLRWNVNSS